MKIFVCIKYVPDTSEVEVELEEDGRAVDTSRFSFDINDADNYAVEEAVLLKEQYGGQVTVLSIGPEDSEIMIRTALAKGADRAIRIEDPRLAAHDPLMVARVLRAAVEEDFDLVLCGCMASDDGHMSVGVAMAQELGVSHAAMVTRVEEQGEGLRVHRELEGGLQEVVDLSLPAVLTIQTGINEPRYASIRGIRSAQKKELTVKDLEGLNLKAEQVDSSASLIKREQLYLPEIVSRAEMIEGEPEEKAEKLAAILKKEGLI